MTLPADVAQALDAQAHDQALVLADSLTDPVQRAQWRGLALRADRVTDPLYEAADALVLALGSGAIAHTQAARLCFNGALAKRAPAIRLGLLHRDLPVARRHAVAAVELDPQDTQAWVVLSKIEDRLGRRHACLEAVDRAVMSDPDDPELRVALAHLHLTRGDRRGALAQVTAGLEFEPDDDDLHDLRARLLVATNDDEASEAIEYALELQPDGLLKALGRWIRLGDLDAAEEAIASQSPSPDALAASARLALWLGDDARALSEAVAVLAQQDHPVARLVRGAVALREGSVPNAIVDFDAVLDMVRGTHDDAFLDEATALTWRALAALGVSAHGQAAQLATQAMDSTPQYNFVAHMVRLLAVAAADSEGRAPADWPHIAKKIDILVEDPKALWTGERPDVLAAITEALTAFQGNRSTSPTLVEDGQLIRFEVPEHPPHTASILQNGLQTTPVGTIVSRYRNLQRRHVDDPSPLTHCGDVMLWGGLFEDAAKHFKRALKVDATCATAWIGEGAAQLHSGDPTAALATWAEHVHAPHDLDATLLTYRGEAHLRLGNLVEAAADLDLSLQATPERLSAWFLRALVSIETGSAHPAKVVCAITRARMPGLWLDAMATISAEPDTLSEPGRRLQAMLTSMQGNRSAMMVTWSVGEEFLRVGTWKKGWMTQEHLRRR